MATRLHLVADFSTLLCQTGDVTGTHPQPKLRLRSPCPTITTWTDTSTANPPHPTQQHYGSQTNRSATYGAHFTTAFCTRGCHWFPRMFASSEQAWEPMAFRSGVRPSYCCHVKFWHNTKGTAMGFELEMFIHFSIDTFTSELDPTKFAPNPATLNARCSSLSSSQHTLVTNLMICRAQRTKLACT
jgi:hypothetical protein